MREIMTTDNLVYTPNAYTKVILYADKPQKSKHLLEYIFTKQKYKQKINNMIDTVSIYNSESSIDIKYRNFKHTIKIEMKYTNEVLSASNIDKSQIVCLLFKLSKNNIFWSDTLQNDSSTTMKAINLLSCSLCSPSTLSPFTQSLTNEFKCSFRTFKCRPKNGTFYSIIDSREHEKLIENMLLYYMKCKIYSNSNLILYIYTFDYPYIIKNQLLCKIMSIVNKRKIENTDNIQLDKLAIKTSRLSNIDDIFTIRKCSIVKLNPQTIIKYQI